MDLNTITRDILKTINAVNRSYTDGWHEEEFRRYIHPDIVAVFPDSPGRIEGKEAYVAEWRDFCSTAVVIRRQETAHRVSIFSGGKASVVTYLFSVTFVMDGREQTMLGRDMFFLVREGRKWLVAAQQFSAEPEDVVSI
ncbi:MULTISPECIES: nuclear transport factor 2 family protein [unclassified Methanoregula]|uniref:YybH family protein n=1 Tax=unclassified Methanoregula TaxID=2649730 RepID=UPI0009C6943F|nr:MULTISPECIES: nuclear transport factor 2 family protein [unclassified Methanoregula]OPX64148.1 MAG: hypothetical protein A4E33_01172 [Methanoregula sp. PtaB.Bin085]OPY34732.1 MAG: hypothetical protein A4E34_01261 [Methanoregula sp. PtaU1.Bin006]